MAQCVNTADKILIHRAVELAQVANRTTGQCVLYIAVSFAEGTFGGQSAFDGGARTQADKSDDADLAALQHPVGKNPYTAGLGDHAVPVGLVIQITMANVRQYSLLPAVNTMPVTAAGFLGRWLARRPLLHGDLTARDFFAGQRIVQHLSVGKEGQETHHGQAFGQSVQANFPFNRQVHPFE